MTDERQTRVIDIRVETANFSGGDPVFFPGALRDKLAPAVEILRSGGIIAFPTETVYGIGARFDLPEAVNRIFEAKGRPHDNPLIAHISDAAMLDRLVDRGADFALEREFRILTERFWPGPLTLILPRSAEVPDAVSAGLDTVGVRMPSDPVARFLIEQTGVPIAAPSANRSGRPSPTAGPHVLDDLSGRVDAVILGCDRCIGLESTVLDLSGASPQVLRPGFVTAEDIGRAIGRQIARSSGDSAGAPRSPGMKYRHYSPEAPLVLYHPEQIDRLFACAAAEPLSGLCCCIAFFRDAERIRQSADHAGIRVEIRAVSGVEDYAAQLFRLLREFDKSGAVRIYAPIVDRGGLGEALMNRLEKAASSIAF